MHTIDSHVLWIANYIHTHALEIFSFLFSWANYFNSIKYFWKQLCSFEQFYDMITSCSSKVLSSTTSYCILSNLSCLSVWVWMYAVAFQDFYSHSNWIELGNRIAFSTLIRADLDFDNMAGRADTDREESRLGTTTSTCVCSAVELRSGDV